MLFIMQLNKIFFFFKTYFDLFLSYGLSRENSQDLE